MIQWSDEKDRFGVETTGATVRLPVFGLVAIELRRVRDDRVAEGSRIEWRVYFGEKEFPDAKAGDLASAKQKAEALIRERTAQLVAAIG